MQIKEIHPRDPFLKATKFLENEDARFRYSSQPYVRRRVWKHRGIDNPIVRAKSYPYLCIISKSIVIAFSLSLEQRYKYCCKSSTNYRPIWDNLYVYTFEWPIVVITHSEMFLFNIKSLQNDGCELWNFSTKLNDESCNAKLRKVVPWRSSFRSTFYLAHAPMAKIFGPLRISICFIPVNES